VNKEAYGIKSRAVGFAGKKILAKIKEKAKVKRSEK
jgi:hypothetical protein